MFLKQFWIMPNLEKKALFSLVNSEINQFADFPENYSHKEEEEFNIKSTLNFAYDQAKSTIACSCGVNCFIDDKIIVKCEVTMTYNMTIETMKDFKDDKELNIPKDILVFFANTTYNSLRGVLMAKLSNSPINLLLPLVNLADIIKKPMKVNA